MNNTQTKHTAEPCQHRRIYLDKFHADKPKYLCDSCYEEFSAIPILSLEQAKLALAGAFSLLAEKYGPDQYDAERCAQALRVLGG